MEPISVDGLGVADCPISLKERNRGSSSATSLSSADVEAADVEAADVEAADVEATPQFKGARSWIVCSQSPLIHPKNDFSSSARFSVTIFLPVFDCNQRKVCIATIHSTEL